MYTISSGFMGFAEIDGVKVRCTDMSVDLEQDALFYNHIYGLRDQIATGSGTKGEAAQGTINIGKKFMRPGVKIMKGSISFPVVEQGLSSIFKNAKEARIIPIKIIYDCENGYTIRECIIDNFSITCSGGEIISATISFTGRYYNTIGGNFIMSTDKLITWDKLNISIGGISQPIQSFNLSVVNSCVLIYTSGDNTTNNLFPSDMRIGQQEVTGSISFFGEGSKIIPLSASTDIKTITMSLPGVHETLTTILKPIQIKGGINYPVTTIAFIGVGKGWE